MRIGLAFRAFFAALFQAELAQRLEEVLSGSPESKSLQQQLAIPETSAEATPTQTRVPSVKPDLVAKPGGRSEALTLLAALQREARLLDLVQEPLESFSDAQVGAAARDVLKSSAGVLARFFGLQPLLNQDEGSVVEVPRGYDPQRFRVVGNVSGEPPFRGQLVHPGWTASKCDLPVWSGSGESVRIVAPAEIELGARQ